MIENLHGHTTDGLWSPLVVTNTNRNLTLFVCVYVFFVRGAEMSRDFWSPTKDVTEWGPHMLGQMVFLPTRGLPLHIES